ncbi:MAG: hypothetical protein LUD77_12005 [Clostridiales bacterium]|nr:hypothetical protein [Clostridiales bacterium]
MKKIRANNDIRERAKENNITLWQIGEVLNLSEFTVVRHLRKELSAEEKEKYFSAIDKIAKSQATA